jgi:S-adenosylmethionine:tRNA ribosyltransferase-isomerase
MKLSQFKFKMPEELIALNPPYHRDECRLMILHRKSQTIDLFKKDEEGNLLDGSEYEV